MPSFFKKSRPKEAAADAAKLSASAATQTPGYPATPTPDEDIPAAPSRRDEAEKQQEQSEEPAPALLDDEDERFLEHLVGDVEGKDGDKADGSKRPMPSRPRTPDLIEAWGGEEVTGSSADAASPKKQKQSRLSRLFHRTSKPKQTATDTTTEDEADREWADLNRVLARLDLSPETKAKAKAKKDKASAELKELVRQFVLVLKDIMRGAPTAVDDLIKLFDGRNDAFRRGFEKLPPGMQNIVTKLPKKMAESFGSEVLSAAKDAAVKEIGKEGTKGVKELLLPKSLGDLTLTPAVVQAMLRAIVNALKLRWPAVVGTSALWSTAVVLLLFVLWYCWKRGKEEREKEERERAEDQARAPAEVEAAKSS
ncbi:uncharacterized protein CTHT_0038160 [Thermochaetoides thermophila DSM 1495]|uniref:Ring-like domain-containing protein n=1 Tax=Chaetomium thermophilum (strain DSM 1495 / CBS 144.50 / IMI 039719) TaxID=759272 RepID=G0S8A8_CHATD|nr:hypothetical protein CTHT_0038160 [Thermochaetoides thermophila DSM 1495]EGS21942.1 hypothetical protein CTHT_0038160 [Thermochaetoides thermophila DSM 1495]